jgi:hypothetical protein
VISTRLLTSTDNTPTSGYFRAPTINSTGKRFLHDKSPFISDWIRLKLTLNMHQKRGCPSLLNVTVLFIKEGMNEEFIWKGDKKNTWLRLSRKKKLGSLAAYQRAFISAIDVMPIATPLREPAPHS